MRARISILAALLLATAAADPGTTVQLPGSPFMTAVSPDGAWVFASLSGGPTPGLAVLRRDGARLDLFRAVKVKGGLGGLVLTPDSELLIATDDAGVVLFNVKRLIAGNHEDALVGVIHEPRRPAHVTMRNGSQPPVWLVTRLSSPGSVQANVTRDGKLLFVSNESAASITVIDLGKVRSTGDATDAILGAIPVGSGPIGLQFSTDGRWLYATVQTAGPALKWPAVCEPENSRGRAGKHAEGAVVVVDVARSREEPAHAVAARVPAGCNPVRLALAPAGDRLYVTARGSHTLLAFDAAALVTDPAHALLARVPVGPSPVPVAVIDGGKRVIVGNSDRFGAGNSGSLSVVDTARMAVVGTVQCGRFPRHLILSPDGAALFVANFGSNSLEVLDAARLPQ